MYLLQQYAHQSPVQTFLLKYTVHEKKIYKSFIILFSRSEFIILPRAQGSYHARIASKLRFGFGYKSFYRFGIRSCLATSHKQILKTPFNMTSSCILGFQATSAATWAHFIHPLFIVLWQIAK